MSTVVAKLTNAETLSPRWISLEAVQRETSLSRRMIAYEREAGRFPEALRFGRRVVFVRTEILDWMAARERERERRVRLRQAEAA